MSEKVETGNDTQSAKERSVTELLDNVTEFIDSVYRDILSPSSQYSLNTTTSPPQRRSLSTSVSSTDEGAEDAVAQSSSSAEMERHRSLEAARAQRNLDADIERINRICDTVDLNLRSIGLLVNTGHGSRSACNTQTNPNNTPNSNNPINLDEITFATPPNQTPSSSIAGDIFRRMPRQRSRLSTIVDLNERLQSPGERDDNGSVVRTVVDDDDDDEVVVVSCNLPPVIDLCTPNNEDQRRATFNRVELSRRNLEDVCQDDAVIPVRRRRISKSSNDKLQECKTETSGGRKSLEGDGGQTNAQRTPFMCPVCMESCIQRRPTSTKCGHVFCAECIKQAVRLTHKCPICNTKISCSQLFRIYV